jgi:hypothetical protein
MFQLTQPGKNLWTTFSFALPYWSLSISLNIISTGLIVGRLFFLRHRVRSALGERHARPYTSVAAMLIESAALDSIIGLIFIISYARNSNVQNLFLPALGQIEVSPILRPALLKRTDHHRAVHRSPAHHNEGFTGSHVVQEHPGLFPT